MIFSQRCTLVAYYAGVKFAYTWIADGPIHFFHSLEIGFVMLENPVSCQLYIQRFVRAAQSEIKTVGSRLLVIKIKSMVPGMESATTGASSWLSPSRS